MPIRRTVGVDIGGTRLLAGAVDAGLGVHHRTQRATAGLDQAALLDTAVDAVEEARNAAGADISAVGFGIPCLSDQGTEGRDSAAPTALAGVPVADLMAERLGVPAFADTVANVVALAEQRAGAARGASEVLVLTIDTGIRAGLILGGKLQHRVPSAETGNATGSSGELAQSAIGIAREQPGSSLALALDGGRFPTGGLVTELAYDGDRAAIDVLVALGRRLGELIAEFVDAYDLQVAVVGGVVIAVGELLLGPARAEGLAARANRPVGDGVPIVPARFGADGGIAGAAALAFDGLERRAREAA